MTKILVAEDEAGVREDIAEVLGLEGFDVAEAEDGLCAIERAVEFRPDLILSDINMPRMDGFGFFKKLHEDHTDVCDVPFIFLTAQADKDAELEGRSLGVSDYLTKPVDFDIMVATIRNHLATAAKADRRVNRKLQELLADKTGGAVGTGGDPATLDHLLEQYQETLDRLHGPLGMHVDVEQVRLRFKTLREARNIAVILARSCPDQESAAIGLTELFVNAVEHGNLEISYADKTRLVQSKSWQDEVERRQDDPAYSNRQVAVAFERFDDRIEINIHDEGKGFDWEKYMTFDPARAADPHGRGIAMSKSMAFTTLEYRGTGSEAVATIVLKG